MYEWPVGITYQGQWKENKKNGNGVLKWLDGSREYSGGFKDDERHGHGQYIWDFGNKSHRGNWFKG